jgi:hypothetical protein
VSVVRTLPRRLCRFVVAAVLPAGGALMTCVAVAVPDRNHRDRGCRIEFDRQHAEMGLGSLELNGGRGPRSTADGLPTRTSVGVKRNLHLPPSRGTQILLFLVRSTRTCLSLSSTTSSGRCS